ncbi:hypothetical protein OXPF_37650 [Oxobacter pfennigii]|uniref:Uncharacterized protein n=1 Tax=Oxobacter pfennigii TaxID=36849 RepID=A0A0P9AC89_9CLOT|nr:hypothetical protein OXPF_37650 [Oxobacter pfennigii]
MYGITCSVFAEMDALKEQKVCTIQTVYSLAEEINKLIKEILEEIQKTEHI